MNDVESTFPHLYIGVPRVYVHQSLFSVTNVTILSVILSVRVPWSSPLHELPGRIERE